MNSKWYSCTFFLILFILFGAFQEKGSTPNQEIVLEFVNTNINKQEIKNTISDVKEKLLKVGVENILIIETKERKLKISYFCTLNVDKVKQALEKEDLLSYNNQKENKDNKSSSNKYKIDIHQLNNGTYISSLDDTFIFEIKYNSDRFSTKNLTASLKNLEINGVNKLHKTAFRISRNDPFTKDHTSYKEPEVRAGPNSHFTKNN